MRANSFYRAMDRSRNAPTKGLPMTAQPRVVRLTPRICILVMSMGLGDRVAFVSADEPQGRPLVIAHRGASGYLPEHTLAAKAVAHAQGADFIEQDVVLTRDDQPIVLHDIHLDSVTNVAQVFPRRNRADGRYYAIDFTLAEIRRLLVTERFDHRTRQRVYPRRFPAGKSRFFVPTLAEEIELIQGLNKSMGRTVGIYSEIKSPAWHRQQGKDISRIVVRELREYGYDDKSAPIFLQCFETEETRRLRDELGVRMRLIQLLTQEQCASASIDKLLSSIAEYANGIGPPLSGVVTGRARDTPQVTPLVARAHELNLAVHPYTLRADDLPPFANSLSELLNLLREAGIDGLFTDHPDRVSTMWRVVTR